MLCRDLILPGPEGFSHDAEILDLLLKVKREILLVLFKLACNISTNYCWNRNVSIVVSRLWNLSYLKTKD